MSMIDDMGTDDARRTPAGRRARHPHDGDHVHRLLRRAEHRSRLAVRHHPAGDPRHRVGPHQRRARATPAGAQHVHRRPLQRSARDRRRRVPGRAADGVGELPPAVPRRATQARRVGPHLRHRPRPRRRRRDVRARGQPARAVGRQLRDREPGGRQAGLRRAVRAPADPTGRRVHRRAQAAADLARARRRRRSAARGAHAGHLQLGLLRALVPRPADGRRARRGCRPRRRRRRLRLHAHDRRARARARDLPPDRRPVPRSRGVPARLDARRAGADAGVEGGQRRASPTRRAPASPTTRSCTPGCPT